MNKPAKKRRPPLLAQASAYFRNAAKADRAGHHKQAEHYRVVAEMLVTRHQRNQEALKRRKEADS